MSKELHISFGNISDTGLAKEFNTDAAIEFKILDGNVFVVCDGHDGTEGHGALAAKMVSESIKKYFYNRSYKDLAKALTNAITYANLALFEQSQKDKKYEGIGSTLTIAICRNGKLYYAYAGDSRFYAYRDKKLMPLTRDHVDDPANAKDADVKILLGRTKDIKFGVCKTPLTVVEGDVFLLCTDGLTDQLSEDEIQDVLADANKAPEHKCRDLIELAKDKGGSDCTSVQVLEFNVPVEPVKAKKELNLKSLLYVLIAVIGLGVVSYGGIKLLEYFNNKPVKVVKVETPVIKQKKTKEQQKKQLVDAVKADNPNMPLSAEKTKVDEKAKIQTLKSGPVFYEHKVVYGENLYRLGLRYNVSQQKLIDLNGNKAKNLVAGSYLKIPVKATHKVKPGESFSVISDKYNVKIKTICQTSNISDKSPLREGQILIIPIVIE